MTRGGHGSRFALIALLFAYTGHAAEFGVPGTSDPAGYLILVSPDAVSTGLSDAFGDVAHLMTFYIEVTSRGLDVDLYDPGLFSQTGPGDQLDVSFDPIGGTGTMRYILYDPDWNILADASFGPDDPTTEGQLVSLYSSNAALPGLYVLDCIYEDEMFLEQDISVFGLSVPDYDVYTFNLTSGHVNLGGATITEPVTAFPYLVAPTADQDAIGPLCGVSFHSYDLNAASNGVAPPTTTVTTQRAYTFPATAFPPSGDGRFWETELAGIPWGPLDSDDHGLYRWQFEQLSAVQETLFDNVAPMDVNVFSIQVLDYGVVDRDFNNWPALPPILSEHPRRIYLGRNGGVAPTKEHMGHRATIVGGYSPITVDEVTTLEVTLFIRNPTSYPLANVAGTTFVIPDLEVSDPTNLVATNVVASINAGNSRQIDISGQVPANTTAEIRYEVTLSPTSEGSRFLTGDGSDFISLLEPTEMSYDAGFTRPQDPAERLGPICMIQYDIEPHPCGSNAVLTTSATAVCPGTPVTLDSVGSTVDYCPGGVAIFQWSVNSVVFEPFPAAASIVVTPFLDSTYTLEVMCSTEPTCIQLVDTVITTYPGLAIDPGSDVTICVADSTDLLATLNGGTPPLSNYLWSTVPSGQPGDGATTPGITVDPTVTTVYTFSAEDSLACTGAESLTVTVSSQAVGAVGPTLLAVEKSTVDVSVSWRDIPGGVGEYRLLSLDCDTNLDGACDERPDLATWQLQPFWVVAPGVQNYVELGGRSRPSFLVFYRVRATSACSLTEGPL